MNDVFQLETKAILSISDKFERKTMGQVAIRAWKRFILFVSNEDMDDIIKIVESIQNSGLRKLKLKDGSTATTKYETKTKKVHIFVQWWR